MWLNLICVFRVANFVIYKTQQFVNTFSFTMKKTWLVCKTGFDIRLNSPVIPSHQSRPLRGSTLLEEPILFLLGNNFNRTFYVKWKYQVLNNCYRDLVVCHQRRVTRELNALCRYSYSFHYLHIMLPLLYHHVIWTIFSNKLVYYGLSRLNINPS